VRGQTHHDLVDAKEERGGRERVSAAAKAHPVDTNGHHTKNTKKIT